LFGVDNVRPRRRAAAVAVAAALSCAGCSTTPPGAGSDNDPLEKINRAVYAANQVTDRAVLKPTAEAYHKKLPAAVQEGVHNIVGNLSEPRVAVDTMLQSQPSRAADALQRLAVNTTVGGVFDVAARWRLAPCDADFGETLWVWGATGGLI
jgi:phospholipid-binding lipoprotein MlaA